MSENIEAPVVFIFFRRPDTTERVFARIRQASPHRLYLVSDGPRNKEERASVDACREIVEAVDWPCEVVRDYSNENLGLKQRVITGLDGVFALEERAIILEDDCLPSFSFFRYCDELLDRYDDDSRLGLLTGNRFHSARTSEYSYDFSHDSLIWGWATWSRVWQQFREDLPLIESGLDDQEIRRLARTFSSSIKKTQFLTQLNSISATKSDTWALYFATFVRLQSLLVAVPEVNLVRNIGFGGISTHTKFEAFDVDVKECELALPLRHPIQLENNPSIERLETRAKLHKWVSFPIFHPLEFIARVTRYLKLNAS